MVICQYFQKGTCKFANNCRFEHSTPNSASNFQGRGGGTFVQQQQQQQQQQNNLNDRYHYTASKGFSNHSNSTTNVQIDNNTILQAFRKELQEWDTNKVWPFSCFSAQREQKCLSGLQDRSPDELRLEAYNYKESGDFQSYVNGLTNLSNQVMNRRNQLKTMSNEQLLQELQSSVTTSTPSTTAVPVVNPFTNPSANLFSTGLAASSQPSGGTLFGTPQTTSSSLFTPNPAGGLFSGNTVVKSSISNPFASSSTGGLFTKPSSTTTTLFGGNSSIINPFATNTPSTPTGGLFSSSSSSSTQMGGIFSSVSTSGASVLPTPFGATSSTPTMNNPFAATTSVNNLFSQVKSTGTLFGSSSSTQVGTQVATAIANPFSSSSPSTQKVVEQSKPCSTNICSLKLPPVTPADIEKFKAPKFVIGQIPTCPPPIELC